MKKGVKMLLFFLVSLAILMALGGAWVLREMRASPSAEELKSYQKLAYFKDGEFQSPEPIFHDFGNVRNGPVDWRFFLTRSRFAPAQKLPKKHLSRQDFGPVSADFAFYWLGHSSAILEIGGKRIVFDPVLENAAPVPFAVLRYDEAPLSRKDLPKVDYIVITHNHYDHLERKTIQSFGEGRFVVPLGVGAALRGWGIDNSRIIELGWGDVFEDGILQIIAETAVHYSGRGLRDRNKTLWSSYVIRSADSKVYWAGDSGYGAHFAEIGRKHGPFDLAAIEIDGWNTGWPNTHMFPHQVVKAAQDLHADRIIPVHWAVFDLALHPWHESIDMLLEEAQKNNVRVLTPMIGEKINWDSITSPWWQVGPAE